VEKGDIEVIVDGFCEDEGVGEGKLLGEELGSLLGDVEG